MRGAAVAVPIPGLGPLTYSVPDGVRDPVVGARVLVPLGKRTVTGVVVAPLECVTERPGSDPVRADDRGLTPKPRRQVSNGRASSPLEPRCGAPTAVHPDAEGPKAAKLISLA